MSLQLLTPPVEEPVSLAEIKAHLRVTHNSEDALITALASAARIMVEQRAGMSLVTSSWRLTLDRPDFEEIYLPVGPVVSVFNVVVIDGQGSEQAVPSDAYEHGTGFGARFRRKSGFPMPGVMLDGVRIDFTAGFGDAAAVPTDLKQAVLMLAGHFYEHREAAAEERLYGVPSSVDALLAPYQQVRL